ncbi:MAG: N-acetylmuramoyl-L-alanine amidase [Candidatus Eisenbacteria bacterium]
MRHADGREERLATRTIGRFEYVSAQDVSLLFGASLYWRSDLLKMTIRLGESRVKVTADNPNVVIDGKGIHLPAPVLFRDGVLLLPLGLVVNEIAPLSPSPVRWDREARVLRFGSSSYRVVGVDASRRGDGLEITVRTAGRPAFRDEVGPEGEILIRFPGTQLSVPDSLPAPPEGGPLEGWSWGISGDTITLLLDPGPSVREWRVARSLRPEGVVVRLGSLPIEDMVGDASGAVEVLTKPKPEGGGRAVIVLDPGHGGADSGCVGAGGLLEKEATLDIALRVGERLRARHGLVAILTREEDVDLSLQRRTEIANGSGGVLFVGLHLNGSPAPNLRGTEVYVLSHGRGARERIQRAVEEATTVYRSEPLGGVLGTELRFVPWDAVQEEHGRAGKSAARLILEELGQVAGFGPRGVREAPAAVLQGANMPALLLELAFLTSPGTEEILQNEEIRSELAVRLADGIARFVGGER